jgi:predicted nucleotidyltransferase component of viral defense system
VSSLAGIDRPDGIFFKGGTALRLLFFKDFRYSADLDFTLVDLSKDDALHVLSDAADECRRALEFPELFVEANGERISYLGPLGTKRTLKLDLATDELVIDTTARVMIARYDDQDDFGIEIPVYSLEEISAEKLRCVIQRLQCRDITDLHHLLVVERLDLDSIWPIFGEKAKHKGFEESQFSKRLESRSSNYERLWEAELEVHFGRDVPHFEQTMRELRRELRSKL